MDPDLWTLRLFWGNGGHNQQCNTITGLQLKRVPLVPVPQVVPDVQRQKAQQAHPIGLLDVDALVLQGQPVDRRPSDEHVPPDRESHVPRRKEQPGETAIQVNDRVR